MVSQKYYQNQVKVMLALNLIWRDVLPILFGTVGAYLLVE